jgi:hypothetical protein
VTGRRGPDDVTVFGWDLTDLMTNDWDDPDLFTSAERTTDGSYEMTVLRDGKTFRIRITQE